MEFKAATFRYWKGGDPQGDCVVRALCATTGFGYKRACELLGVGDQFVMGKGYGWKSDHGISISQFDQFARRTGIVRKIWVDEAFEEWLKSKGSFDLPDLTGEDMLEYFVDEYLPIILDEKHVTRKNFIVDVTSNKAKSAGDDLNFHATVVYRKGDKWINLDTRGNESVRYAIPRMVYAVEKSCNPKSPSFWSNEKARILAEWNREESGK